MLASRPLRKWLIPGIQIKRWLILIGLSLFALALTLACGMARLGGVPGWHAVSGWSIVGALVVISAVLAFACYRLMHALFVPYRRHQQGHLIDIVVAHNRRNRGTRVAAIGGGTGLPSVLRAMKAYTSNITAIVTVADDGGSSGRLRRELGGLPPGDLRNNIAALADDENLITQLFQYRFAKGELGGHAFGNLFISALAGVTGSLEEALIETGRVLNIQGRVLPATLADITLSAQVRMPNGRIVVVHGESQIPDSGGRIEAIALNPPGVRAYHESVTAILEAEIVVLGPGSLYTSIIPNLLISDIADALRRTTAHKIYVCNIATQAGETDRYTVADHIIAIEQIIGRGVIDTVLANSACPTENAGENTHFVALPAPDHEVCQRYQIHPIDLVDELRPWRHDPQKLAQAILETNDSPVPPVRERAAATAPVIPDRS
jgi:uncharacterized cofD-like protein